MALSGLFTGSLSWRRLGVLLRGLPTSSRSHAAITGEERWSRTDSLLAGLFDQLAIANWQRSGSKRTRRPKPLPRPGVKPAHDKRIGSESMPIDEWRRRYAARFPERGDRHGRRAGSGLRVDHPEREGDARATRS